MNVVVPPDVVNEEVTSVSRRLEQENAELKRELQRLSMVVEGTKAGSWEWNIVTGKVTINHAWAEMIGYTADELGQVTFDTWEKLTHAKDLREATTQLERHLRGETVYYEAEVRMQHKNGHWIWILDRGKVFEHDRDGNPLRMAGSHQDITERKHAEEQLKQEINLFLEGPVTVFRWLNTEGYPTAYVSPNVTVLTGYSPTDFTSGIITFTDIVHPDDLTRIFNDMRRYSSEPARTSFEAEYRIIRKDGTIAWLYEFTTIIRSDDGHITRYESYILDNTLRKQSELEIAYNRRFENLISRLANKFINTAPEQINTMIDKALQWIGRFVRADRSYIFQYYDNQRLMDNTHEWCAEGIDPQIGILQKLPTSDFPWSTQKISRNEVIIVPRVADLPDEAASEREILELQDIKSLILIPLISGRKPFGYIGFDAVKKERQWPSNSAAILALAGGIIANALQRKQVERLIQSELDLALKLSASESFEETVRHCLHTALDLSGMDCGGIYLVNESDAHLNLVYSEGVNEEFITAASTYMPEHPEYTVMMSGTVFYSDQLPDINEQMKIKLEREGLKSFAILPVISKNRVIAVFTVASHMLGKVPDCARKALETVTSHIGASIMQSRHEERVSALSRNLEALFGSIDDMLFVTAADGTILHANAATTAAIGYSLDELRSMNVIDIHPADQREDARKRVEEMIAGVINFCTIPVFTKSGCLIPVETRVTQGTWDGKPVIFGITRDISAQLKSQSALVESEKKFRELTEYLPFPLFETDLRGIVNYMNLSGMEFFDISSEEIQQGVSAFSFCWPENLELAVANQQKIFDPGYIPQGNEYTVVMKDGRRLPLLLYNTPIRKESKFTGMRTTVVDLSELKRAEVALRENALQKRVSEEFRSIINNIPGIVYHLSIDNTIRFLSESRQEWPKGVIQPDNVSTLDHVMSFIHPEDLQIVVETCKKLRRTPSSTVTIFRVSLPDKSVRWLENRSTSVFSDDGRFSGIDGILFDITERVTAQEEKQQLEENLKKTQRLETIGTLAGGIAHDFNNILGPILGYAEMGVVLLTEDNRLREFFTQIMLAAERAQNLVSQILTFSRSEEYKPVVVRVQSVIDEALKLLRPTIPSTISINIDSGQCGNVLADPSQLHQVIVNLCTNAFQSMAESGGRMSIELREIAPDSEFRRKMPALKADAYMQLSVTDTGHGMDEATKERIFEPFFTTKPVNKGTGLGLSVVHGIINSFNGDISVESSPGKGSTFRVWLPVIRDEVRSESGDNLATNNNPGTRVLFVDDELAAIEVMRVMMGHLGFNILALNSPIEALAEFRKDPEAFDLLISDLTMPEMTGIELARNLYELNPELPMILMTGYGKDIENAASLSRYGIRKLLKKPVRLGQLAQAIREVMSGIAHL